MQQLPLSLPAPHQCCQTKPEAMFRLFFRHFNSPNCQLKSGQFRANRIIRNCNERPKSCGFASIKLGKTGRTSSTLLASR